MIKAKIFTIVISTLFFSSSYALSPEAEVGKTLYPTCHICHNPELDKPLGPPMWGVQRRYKKATFDKDDFVKNMASFVKAPSLETAIHDEALKNLGLMPALPLADNLLKNISTYIYEEKFAAPCTHWRFAVQKAKANNDEQHAKKDQQMLNRFCQ
ncbi:MAG: hypothetical protein ISR69_08115 [Gammaproteobacteria bacterium]|nr:hypothetical protein [Gammaproteobacteria bacterium]